METGFSNLKFANVSIISLWTLQWPHAMLNPTKPLIGFSNLKARPKRSVGQNRRGEARNGRRRKGHEIGDAWLLAAAEIYTAPSMVTFPEPKDLEEEKPLSLSPRKGIYVWPGIYAHPFHNWNNNRFLFVPLRIWALIRWYVTGGHSFPIHLSFDLVIRFESPLSSLSNGEMNFWFL